MGSAPSTPTFDIHTFRFREKDIAESLASNSRFGDWPAVYTLSDARHIYVGESLNVAARLRQHRRSPEKRNLAIARVVLDEKFNKSAALDLESYLIRLLAGDGQFEILNRNDGITDANYFARAQYREAFRNIFDHLRSIGIFRQSERTIENSDLFKLSPFKALTADQEQAVSSIVGTLLSDIVSGQTSTSVVNGDPGTGKTVVGIYLMKLLSDLGNIDAADIPDADAPLSEFFVDDRRAALRDLKIGLVIPQQSLRTSVRKVFAKTPGLSRNMVLTPFEIGKSSSSYDLLIVDETHRLAQRANMSSAAQNRQFSEINERLFGDDDVLHTQLDWIRAQSRHQVFLLDSAQTVRPADLPRGLLEGLTTQARRDKRQFTLESQMRVAGGRDYIAYVRKVLSDAPPPERMTFGASYELRLFDSLRDLREELLKHNSSEGLARLVAGYAWPWNSKRDPDRHDIELDGLRLQWNRTAIDWINSATSIDEVGSIHTIQGYDLNYAGVIIGDDLRYDPDTKRLWFSREDYYDSKGKENNPRLGRVYNDDDLLEFVLNIYAVLMTRGICGTYVYATDPHLRDYLRRYI